METKTTIDDKMVTITTAARVYQCYPQQDGAFVVHYFMNRNGKPFGRIFTLKGGDKTIEGELGGFAWSRVVFSDLGKVDEAIQAAGK